MSADSPAAAAAALPSPVPVPPPLIAARDPNNPDALIAPQVLPSEPVPITDQEVGEYREQDRFLPIANVARIMKSSVPPTAKIAKDAKECVQECVSEFISFITSEAAEKCLLEKRKTIGGEDILGAMASLGFDDYVQVLKIYLAKLRQNGPGTGAAGARHGGASTSGGGVGGGGGGGAGGSGAGVGAQDDRDDDD